jgi:hypothetical protein
MGHVRLGRLPGTRKWKQVVALLSDGADLDIVAAASSDAAEASLARAPKDPALVQAFWLLTQIPLAARKDDFGRALRELGLPVGSNPGLFDVVAAFSAAVDRSAREVGGRSDLGEMAQLSASETLASLAGRDLPGLFGPTPDDVRLSIGKLATTDRFSDLARDFFARLTKRHLDYYLSRELSNHVGAGERFGSIAEHSAFDAALDLHCREASRIIKEFAGGWYSKKNFEAALTPAEAGSFAYVAFKKIRSELRRKRGDAD